jgi:hypothetical protein
MKTFLMVLASLLLIIVLLIGGSAFYVYKNAGSLMSKADDAMIEKFVQTRHPNAHVLETLKRIDNAAKLNTTMPVELLAITALSVLSLPDAVTAEQEVMLDDAAALLEKPGVSMVDVQLFQKKYEALLPTHPAPRAPGVPATPHLAR